MAATLSIRDAPSMRASAQAAGSFSAALLFLAASLALGGLMALFFREPENSGRRSEALPGPAMASVAFMSDF